MLSNITNLYKLMIIMKSKTCYKTSHTSINFWCEKEETHVLKHHIALKIDDGNGKLKMLSNIT